MGNESKKGYRVVALDKCRPNSWNPNQQSPDMFRNLLYSIRKNGFVSAITCRYLQEDDVFEIIEGEHRWKAVKELTEKGVTLLQTPTGPELPEGKIMINCLGVVDDVSAMAMTQTFNRIQGVDDEAKLAGVIKTIMEKGDEETISTLPYSESDLQFYSSYEEFDAGSLLPPEEGIPNGMEEDEVPESQEFGVLRIIEEVLALDDFPLEEAQEFKDRYLRFLNEEGIRRIEGWRGLLALLDMYESSD